MSGRNRTIYDIAAEAEVSITTVSRVLRGQSSVSPATRARVEAVIAKHQYRPSSIARGMTSKRTDTIGIILPRISNPNYAMIFDGAVEEARKNGLGTTLFPWQSLLLQDNGAQMLTERRLDGVILYVEYLPDEDREHLVQTLAELRQYMPVVLIGSVPSCLDYPTVYYDMAALMRRVMDSLIALGHERIAMIGGAEADRDEFRRDVGYDEKIREARLPMISSYRVFCQGTAEAGETALDRILSSLKREYWPTAVIALNDLVGMGVMASARRHGLCLPEDLSVVGCDNLFCAPYLTPALTSIDLRQQQLGARAVQLLLSGEKHREEADWELVVRDSCAAPPTHPV